MAAVAHLILSMVLHRRLMDSESVTEAAGGILGCLFFLVMNGLYCALIVGIGLFVIRLIGC